MIRCINTEVKYFDECNYIVYAYVGSGKVRVNIAAYIGKDDGSNIIDKITKFAKSYANGKQ